MTRSSASTTSAPSGDVAPSSAALLLSLAATVAAFGVLSPLAHWAIKPVDLGTLGTQNQHAENLVFLASFAVALPLAVALIPRALDRISRRLGRDAARDVALVLAIALCVLLAAVKLAERISSASHPALLLIASLLWLALATAAVAGMWRWEVSPAWLARVRPALWPALAVSLGALALCFADLGSISLVPLAAGLALAAAAGYWVAFRPRVIGAMPEWLRWGADVVAVVLIALAVPNLVIFRPDDPSASFETTIIQFHQNFFLGPANDLIGGRTMLVDVVSQYGVGSILFLAGVFKLIPIGNGTLGFTEGVLAAGMFSLAYVALRLVRVRLVLAWATLAVAVFILVFNLVYPLGGLLQHGAFRFGMPMMIVAAAAGETRATGRGQAVLRGVQAAVVGIASFWALEAFLYSVGAFAGLLAFRAATAPEGRMRIVVRFALQALAACVVVQVIFALATLIGTGDLPDWGKYLTTLREFLTGKVGELTYDFSPWSGGLVVGALYAASAIGLALVVWRERALTEANRARLLVLSGTTGYGIALFSYFVNRSADHILPYISLPAVMVVALWLTIVLSDDRLPRLGRGLAVGSAAAGAALLVAIAWSGAGLRFSQSALAYAAPGGKSLSGALHRLWHPPQLAPGATDAERMLETNMPGEHESLVLTSADLSIEALMKTHRINEIPLSYPWEDSLLPDLHEAPVKAAVAGLRPGRLMLIDQDARELLKTQAAGSGPSIVPSGLAPLQVLALREIGARFRLEPVARAPSGVEVVRLRAR